MNFRETYQQLNGKEPTADDVLRFERLVTALETTPNDALLAVLVALDHYQMLYAAIPAMIAKAANDTLGDVKTTADIAMNESAGEATKALAKAVSETAAKVATSTAKKQMYKWAAGCLAVAFVAFASFGYYLYDKAYTSGVNSGYAIGYKEAKDEKAAAAWANTPEGKVAYKLAQTGFINNFARCDKPGWYIDKKSCFVKTAEDGKIYGWLLP